MAQFLNTTASGQVKTGTGRVFGFIVNSHTSGTLRFNDGLSGTTSTGVKATGVLTGSDVFTDGETITIGTVTYTMVDELSGAAYEVLIGASLAASLDNLKVAINADTGEGTVYGTGTVANPHGVGTTNTDTAQTFEFSRVGTEGNAIATTETAANAAWGAATLENGANPSTLLMNTFTPAAGSGIFSFPEPIDFVRGLYFTEGGTADVTIIYE